MGDLRAALEHESESFDLAPDAFQRMLDRRKRKHAERRLVAGVVVLALVVASAWVLASLSGVGRGRSVPARPSSSIEGTWRTGRLDRADVVAAFVAAGGTSTAGRAFFAQLGGGATRFAVITLRFERGTFVQFESGDGGPPIQGYKAPYRVSNGLVTISSPSCTGTYSFDVRGSRLMLQVVRQCRRHDGPYNTTLFASFPFTKPG